MHHVAWYGMSRNLGEERRLCPKYAALIEQPVEMGAVMKIGSVWNAILNNLMSI